jgi:hypothetical protein
VPRKLDAQSMLPYLTTPQHASIRTWNFTQVAPNLQKDRAVNPPCVIGNACTQIPVTQSVCTDNKGVWWGPQSITARYFATSAQPTFAYCCQVNEYLNSNGQPTNSLQSLRSVAVRNDRYKLVKNFYLGHPKQRRPPYCEPLDEDEIYQINEEPVQPLLDYAPFDLLKRKRELTDEEKENLLALRRQLQEILRSDPPCPGDGNIDGVVNHRDESFWSKFSQVPERDGYNSSWYDFNLDGLTNDKDLAVIVKQRGRSASDAQWLHGCVQARGRLQCHGAPSPARGYVI